MAIAAVPDYLGRDFSSASPGLRFGMYLQVWSASFAKEKDKVEPLKRAGKLNDNDKNTMAALIARQQAGFKAIAANSGSWQLDAIATAPFTTGLGNEHPLENGFAFLNPCGLPYLPGSGVKGVLRQAARELASGEWGDGTGWTQESIYPLMVGEKPVLDKDQNPVLLSMLDVLFGRETESGDSNHLRGALSFWDVIPQIKGDSLSVEIMTPHQKHYYQEGQNPHDSGQPVPISFLTVPPGSAFTFHVQCNLALLKHSAPQLLQDDRWQLLLQAAFAHAFDWLGFGAKTAVGYGAMLDKRAQAERAEADRQARAEQEALARQENLKQAGIEMGGELWADAVLKEASPGSGEVTVTNADGSKTAKGAFYAALSDAAKKRFKNKKAVRLEVEVEIQGNLTTIKSVKDMPQQ